MAEMEGRNPSEVSQRHQETNISRAKISSIKCHVQLKERKIPTPKAEGRIRNSGKG